MSSIYISICSLYDRELIPTIKHALLSSSGKNKIYFGIALSSTLADDYAVETIKKNIENLSTNFKFIHFDKHKYKGTGVGRRIAYSMYDGQDYLLQIDSHSKFYDGWDEILIDQLDRAENQYGESVLTGYPDSYFYKDKKPYVKNGWMPSAPYFVNSSLSEQYSDVPDVYSLLPNFKERYVECVPGTFQLAKKISGGFLFGGKRFAENYNELINYDYTLPEEELFMSIELINLNFNLIIPNEMVPISHLYYEDICGEEGGREILSTEYLYRDGARDLILDYIEENIHKIKIFEKYAAMSMFNHSMNI